MHRHSAQTPIRWTLGVMLCLAVGCSAPAPPAAAPTSAPAPAAAAPTTAPAAAAKPTTAPAAAAAPTTAPAAAGASQNLIIALDQADVKTLDPAREFEFAAAFVVLNTYDTLVTQKSADDLNTFVPVLAKSWTISPDGKEYTFVLRDDVKFA